MLERKTKGENKKKVELKVKESANHKNNKKKVELKVEESANHKNTE
jgi:hypothetical protein